MPNRHVSEWVVVAVTDAERVRLGWQVVADEWSAFTGKVGEEWGGTSPYAGLAVEIAWREYRSDDRLEALADRLAAAAGVEAERPAEKNFPRQSLAGLETERVWVRVHADVKQDMAQFALANGMTKAEVLRAVINGYVENDRETRVARNLSRAVPAAEAALAELDGREGLTASERKEIQAARALPERDEFAVNLAREKVSDALGVTSAPTIEKWTNRALERRGFEVRETPYPGSPDWLSDGVEMAVRWDVLTARERDDSTRTSPNRAMVDGGETFDE